MLDDRFVPMFNLLKKYHGLPLSKRPQMHAAIDMVAEDKKQPTLARRRLSFVTEGKKYEAIAG